MTSRISGTGQGSSPVNVAGRKVALPRHENIWAVCISRCRKYVSAWTYNTGLSHNFQRVYKAKLNKIDKEVYDLKNLLYIIR